MEHSWCIYYGRHDDTYKKGQGSTLQDSHHCELFLHPLLILTRQQPLSLNTTTFPTPFPPSTTFFLTLPSSLSQSLHSLPTHLHIPHFSFLLYLSTTGSLLSHLSLSIYLPPLHSSPSSYIPPPLRLQSFPPSLSSCSTFPLHLRVFLPVHTSVSSGQQPVHFILLHFDLCTW